MNVAELKKILEDVPDDYEIHSRSLHAYNGDTVEWSRHITSSRVLEKHKAIMLIGDNA